MGAQGGRGTQGRVQGGEGLTGAVVQGRVGTHKWVHRVSGPSHCLNGVPPLGRPPPPSSPQVLQPLLQHLVAGLARVTDASDPPLPLEWEDDMRRLLTGAPCPDPGQTLHQTPNLTLNLTATQSPQTPDGP